MRLITTVQVPCEAILDTVQASIDSVRRSGVKCERGKRFEGRQQQDVESGLKWWQLAARLQQSGCLDAGVLALKLRSSMGTKRLLQILLDSP